MNVIDSLKNTFFYSNKYKTHSEAIIISCYFNPQNNPYRLSAFTKFYESIHHLNHHIVECVIGDSSPQLAENSNISRIKADSLLWHKESILNHIVSKLDPKYKYVFWVDADVIFTNKSWLVESVKSLQTNNLVQPFEHCVHLDKDEYQPSFNLELEKIRILNYKLRHPKLWRSFGYNHSVGISHHENYDIHGHVGFAWGARREVLDAVPLYDRALVGGADHIIAHAAAGHIGHSCIAKSFTDDLEAVNSWSQKFYNVVKGKIGYVKGDLFHIWHGNLEDRQYLKRVQEFTKKSKTITERDKNGLHVTKDDSYVRDYFEKREVKTTNPNVVLKKRSIGISTLPTKVSTAVKNQIITKRNEFIQQYPDQDDSFITSLLVAYVTDNDLLGYAVGGNFAGALIGDMLNDADQPVEFNGGEFGGGGAGSNWDDNSSSNDSTDNNEIVSDNFS